MGSDAADRIDTLRERICTSDSITADDCEALTAFSDRLRLLSMDYSDHRHEKLLRHCTLIAEQVGGLAAALDDRGAAENIVQWINTEYSNEETNRDYRVALRVFGRRVTDENGDEPPKSIEWVPSGTASNYSPKPDPREMLHWDEHIRPMIDATENPRDAAMIAVAWDAGARSGEFRSLTVGDVTDHPNGLQITVDGKTGQRTITLIPSVPQLNQWLASHDYARTDQANPDAPLWPHKSDNSRELSYNGVMNVFSSAAERANVVRPVTLTNFRKSSASLLAFQGLPQAHIEDHHGWVRGSDVAARYVSVFSDDADRALAEAHGLDIEPDEPDPTGPKTCLRCDRQTPRDQPACVWCGQATSAEAAETVREQDRALMNSAASEDTSLRREDIAEFAELVDENPVLRRVMDGA